MNEFLICEKCGYFMCWQADGLTAICPNCLEVYIEIADDEEYVASEEEMENVD